MKKAKKEYSVSFKGKKIKVRNYILCESILAKTRGLMFRPGNFKIPLVFLWKKPGKYSIHSFFCRKFLAVWISDGKIIEKRAVNPWKFSIFPEKSFDTLIEIPL